MKKFKVLFLIDIDALIQATKHGVSLDFIKKWVMKLLLSHSTSNRPVGGFLPALNEIKWGFHIYSNRDPNQVLVRPKTRGFLELNESSFEEFETALSTAIGACPCLTSDEKPKCPFVLKAGVQTSLADFQFDQPDVSSPVLQMRKSELMDPENVMYIFTKVPLSASEIELYTKKVVSDVDVDCNLIRSLMLPNILFKKIFTEMKIRLRLIDVLPRISPSFKVKQAWEVELAKTGGNLICLNDSLVEFSDFDHIKSDNLLFKSDLEAYLQEMMLLVPEKILHLKHQKLECSSHVYSKWHVPDCDRTEFMKKIILRQNKFLPPLELQDKIVDVISSEKLQPIEVAEIWDKQIPKTKTKCEIKKGGTSKRGLQLLYKSKEAASNKRTSLNHGELEQDAQALKSRDREKKLTELRNRVLQDVISLDNYDLLIQRLTQLVHEEKETEPVLLVQTLTNLMLSSIRNSHPLEYKIREAEERFLLDMENHFLKLFKNDFQGCDYSQESIQIQIREYQLQIILLFEMMEICSNELRKAKLERQVLKLVTLLTVKSGNMALGSFLEELVSSYSHAQADVLHQVYEEVNLPLPTLLIDALTPSKLVSDSDDPPTSVNSEAQSLQSTDQSIKDGQQSRKLQRHSSFISIQERKKITIKRSNTDLGQPVKKPRVRRNLFSPDGKLIESNAWSRRSIRTTPNKYRTPNKFLSGTILVPATPANNAGGATKEQTGAEVVAETPENKLKPQKCLNTDELNRNLKLTRRGSFYSDNHIGKSRNLEKATNRLLAEKIRGSHSDFFSDLSESFTKSWRCGNLLSSNNDTEKIASANVKTNIRTLFRPSLRHLVKSNGGPRRGVKRLFSDTCSPSTDSVIENLQFSTPVKNICSTGPGSSTLDVSPDWITPKKRVEFAKNLISSSRASGLASPDLFQTPKSILKSPSVEGTPKSAMRNASPAVSNNLSYGTPFKTPTKSMTSRRFVRGDLSSGTLFAQSPQPRGRALILGTPSKDEAARSDGISKSLDNSNLSASGPFTGATTNEHDQKYPLRSSQRKALLFSEIIDNALPGSSNSGKTGTRYRSNFKDKHSSNESGVQRNLFSTNV